MAIKRGVSTYSYQRAQILGKMDYKDMFREMRDNLGCDGVEIIDEAIVPGYPFATKEFLADWYNSLALYGMKPVALDGFLDTMRFRDHVMTHAEAAELIKLDLQLAHDMGFTHIRTMTGLPTDVIAMALPTAEKLDVKIAWEVHAPVPIKPDPTVKGIFCDSPGTAVADTVEFIEKTGTKHVGFVPDMGIFARGPFYSGVMAMIHGLEDRNLASELEHMVADIPLGELGAEIEKRFPGKLTPDQMRSVSFKKSTAQPEDIELILPYVLSIHGKCHDLNEIPGQPGHYEEPALLYKEVIDILKKHDWDGYICTEYEGQRSHQGMGHGIEGDEIEQVRRHHEMLRRLIGE